MLVEVEVAWMLKKKEKSYLERESEFRMTYDIV